MKFFKLQDGSWANLEHVASIRPVNESYRLVLANGQQLTASAWDVLQIENVIDPCGENAHRMAHAPKAK